jgi:hypothetical protein
MEKKKGSKNVTVFSRHFYTYMITSIINGRDIFFNDNNKQIVEGRGEGKRFKGKDQQH